MANSIKRYFQVLPKSFVREEKKEPLASSNFGLLPYTPKLNSEHLNGVIKILTVRVTKIREKLKINDVLFQCQKCPTVCKTFNLMRDHNQKSHPAKRVSCSLCKLRFVNRTRMLTHKDFHHESKNGKLKQFQCDHCPKSFDIKSNIICHLRSHLRPKAKGIRRISVADGTFKFKCDVCPNVYRLRKSLNDHKEIIHESKEETKKKYQCGDCSRSFRTKQNLNRHWRLQHHRLSDNMKKRLSVRPSPDEFGTFACDACEKVFSHFSSLNNHKELAHESESQLTKTYLCEFCPRSFNLKENLNNHLKGQHSSENGISYLKKPKARKDFPCVYCKMVFPNGLNLQTHIDSAHPPENGTGKHLCEYCAVSFRFKSNLNSHLASKHFQFNKSATRRVCKMCNQTFGKQSSLHRHQDYHHNDPNAKSKAHQCTDCPHSFSLKENLHRHMSSKHRKSSEQSRCNLCQSKFVGWKSLRLHQDYFHPVEGGSSKAYQCDNCPRSFNIKSNVEKHWNSKHKSRPIKIIRKPDAYGKYPCDLCEEYFTNHLYLRDHKEIHHQLEGSVEERKFKCKKCSTTYSTKATYIRHMESAHKQARKRVYESRKKFRFHSLTDFICNECGKDCIDQSRLNEHTELFHEISTGEQKRHQCTECSSSFNFISNLKRHTKADCLHSNEIKLTKKYDTESRRSTRLNCNTMLLEVDVVN